MEHVTEQHLLFLAKLNTFMETLSPQEQAWLAALVTQKRATGEVQGYEAPLSLGLPAQPLAALPNVGLGLRKSAGNQASGVMFLSFL